MVLSEEILSEYQDSGGAFTKGKADGKFYRFLNLIAQKTNWAMPVELPEPVCTDPDDDKFIACALGGGAEVIVSGDKALLACSGYRGIQILSLRDFVDRFLEDSPRS